MNKSHQTFKQCVSLSRVKSLAKNNFRASITGRKWACESLQIHQQVRRSYWDTKAETSSPKPKRWIFGPLFGSGDFRGASALSVHFMASCALSVHFKGYIGNRSSHLNRELVNRQRQKRSEELLKRLGPSASNKYEAMS